MNEETDFQLLTHSGGLLRGPGPIFTLAWGDLGRTRGARSSGGCPYKGTRPADRQLLWSNFRPDFPAGLRASPGESTHSWGWIEGNLRRRTHPTPSLSRHLVTTGISMKNVQLWGGRVEPIWSQWFGVVQVFKISNWCSLVKLDTECWQCWTFQCFECLVLFPHKLQHLENTAQG